MWSEYPPNTYLSDPQQTLTFPFSQMTDPRSIKRRVHYQDEGEDDQGGYPGEPGEEYEPYSVEDYDDDVAEYGEPLPPPRGRRVVYEVDPRRGGVPPKKRKHNIKSQRSLEEWNQFAKIRRAQLKVSHPNLNYTDSQKKIGEEWKARKNKLTEEQKSVKDWETLVKWVIHLALLCLVLRHSWMLALYFIYLFGAGSNPGSTFTTLLFVFARLTQSVQMCTKCMRWHPRSLEFPCLWK